MIKSSIVFQCATISLAVAWGEEVRERAYYLGTKNELHWGFTQNGGDVDPFAADPEPAPELTMVPLEKAPFQSRYFSEGNQLLDLTAGLRNHCPKEAKIGNAVFNETTGRLVVLADDAAHEFIEPIARSIIVGLPRMIRLTVKVYQVPIKGFGVSRWNGVDLETDHRSLVEAEVMTRPGAEAVINSSKGALVLNFEPQVGSNDEIIDSPLELSGEVKGHSFKLKTGVTLYNGVPAVIELGAMGGEEPLLLLLKPEIILVGGVKSDEAILDHENPPKSPFAKMIPPSVEEKWEPDPETGKVFRRFSVPPTFVNFIDSGGGGGEADPFATDEPAKSESKYLVKSWSPKLKLELSARVFDLRILLEYQGLEFAGEDFAYLVENDSPQLSSTLCAELDSANMELLYAIISAAGPANPVVITCSASLIEGTKKIEAHDLKREDLRCLVKSGLVALPGRNSTLELRKGPHAVLIEMEQQVGAADDQIDLRGGFQWLDGKETTSQWNSGVTLSSGKKQIVASYRKGEKWYSLVFESRAELMTDWLLGE
jgi:hypothetical protein